MLSFFSSGRNWDSPNPSPGSPVEGHTRWRERGWESPSYDDGAYTAVLFIYTYFVRRTLPLHTVLYYLLRIHILISTPRRNAIHVVYKGSIPKGNNLYIV